MEKKEKKTKKNRLGFLKSMRFGMVLLVLIAMLSLVGTLIEQGRPADFYEHVYGGWSKVILAVNADDIYHSVYYAGLFFLLSVNLLCCSTLRIGKVKKAKAMLLDRAEKSGMACDMPAEGAEDALKKLGFKDAGSGRFVKRSLGLYGSFLTHLGMVLLIAAAVCTFTLIETREEDVPVGESVTLDDGSVITVDTFSMENEKGQLDYLSDLTFTGADGKKETVQIAVNHPAHFGPYTIYQQSYNRMGVLDVRTSIDGEDERICLDGEAFISLDGQNGVAYGQIFDDYKVDEDGAIVPVQSSQMRNPAYLIMVVKDGAQKQGVALVDEMLEVSGVYYTFRTPEMYPGLKIKKQPQWVIPALYTSFAVLLLGLYLCFFHVPAAACVRDGKVYILGDKDTDELAAEMGVSLNKDKKEKDA